MNDRQGRTGGVIAGGILVILGVLFLVRDQIDIDWGLIWPFFLIIPGAYVLAKALFARDHRDRTGGFIGGAILLFLGCVFLAQNYYDLDWQKIWPFFLIIPGVGLLVGALMGWGRRENRAGPQSYGGPAPNQPYGGPGATPPQPPPPGSQPPAA